METGEDFMTGLDEDGFMGLEEMDSPMIFSLGAQPPGNAAAENGSGTAATAAAGAPTSAAKAGKKASNKAKSKPLPVTEAQVEESAATQPPSSSAPVASGTDAVNGGGSVIVPEAAAELKQGAAKQLERVRAQQERSKQVWSSVSFLPARRACTSAHRLAEKKCFRTLAQLSQSCPIFSTTTAALRIQHAERSDASLPIQDCGFQAVLLHINIMNKPTCMRAAHNRLAIGLSDDNVLMR